MTDITISINDYYDEEIDNAFLYLYPTTSGTGREVVESKVNDYVMGCLNQYRKKQHQQSLVMADNLTVSGG